jgi:phage terminase small subunit
MGQRGPKPVPTAQLAARGSWRAKAADRANEPKVAEDIKPPPVRMTEAGKRVFKELRPVVESMKVLTAADYKAFGLLCDTQGYYEDNAESMSVNERATILGSIGKLMACFGLTPADRARVNKAPEKGKDASEGKGRFFKPRIAGA